MHVKLGFWDERFLRILFFKKYILFLENDKKGNQSERLNYKKHAKNLFSHLQRKNVL